MFRGKELAVKGVLVLSLVLLVFLLGCLLCFALEIVTLVLVLVGFTGNGVEEEF